MVTNLQHHDAELTNTHNASSESSRSTNSARSSSSGDQSSAGDQEDKLDFAKREISDHQGRNSYSQLSSMTARSPELAAALSKRHKQKRNSGGRNGGVKSSDGSNSSGRRSRQRAEDSGMPDADGGHHPHHDNNNTSTVVDDDDDDDDGDDEDDDDEDDDEDDDHGVEPDHQERIRNPASLAFRKPEQRERIGFRQPFSDTEGNSSSSQDSQEQAQTNTPGSSTQTSPTDFSTFGKPSCRRRLKHYEPARVVIHKSDLGLDESGTKDNGNNEPTNRSETPSRSSSMMPLSQGGSPESRPRGSVSHSLMSSVTGGSSSEDLTAQPLKHLREPKQPIYIPAVLRPTDFSAYHSQFGFNKVSADAPRKPITQHWVRDVNAKTCRTCDKQFNWFRRRHHCRKCGGVFCSNDASHTIGLDRVLNFNILGLPCRACDECAAEFSAFCLDAPRLRDNAVSSQQPMPGPELEETEVGGGGDWSTF